MFVTFLSRTHYQTQSARARLYEARQVIECSDADGANLKAMGLAKDSSREEITKFKEAAKADQEYVVPPPKPEKHAASQPTL